LGSLSGGLILACGLNMLQIVAVIIIIIITLLVRICEELVT
jgi:hypothetical protein